MPMIARFLLASLLCAAGCASIPTPTDTTPVPPLATKVLVIGHRGASALRPEHTLESYRKAIEDGADIVEPDLVSTGDGVLVARHENEISGTTDVAAHPEFAARKATKTIDGERVTGWFTEDFTLAELKTLRARERLPELRDTARDGQYEIPTFDEIVALVEDESARRGRTIGLVPEIKHSTYFAGIGLAMEDRLLDALHAHAYTRTAPVIVQSFETANLRALREKIGHGSNIRLLQLFGSPDERPWDTVAAGTPRPYRELMRPEGLREVAGWADAIGPAFRDLDPQDGRSRLVDDAHAAGLQVIVYTFRPENHFLGPYAGPGGPAARSDDGMVRLVRAALALGIDAFFTDDPALGRRAVDGG